MRRRVNTGMVVLSLVVALGLLRCDMFSVRPSEQPDPQPYTDWLNLQQVLKNSAEEFRYNEYEELFRNDFRYTQGTGPAKGKRAMTTRLEAIDALQPNIYILWIPPTDFVGSKAEGVITWQNNVQYLVYLSPQPTGAPEYIGHAHFGLTYSGSRWVLVYWEDEPMITVEGFSFFNPDFVGR